MDFGRSDEQRAIAEVARGLLGEREGGKGLWTELSDLGWPGIAIGEEFDGQGLGVSELSVLVEELGYACADDAPLLGSTLAALAIEEGADDDLRGELLPALAAGRTLGAFTDGRRDEAIPDAAPERLLVVADPAGVAALHRLGAVEEIETIDGGRRHGRILGGLGAGEPLPKASRRCGDIAAVVVSAELVGICRRALELTLAYIKDRRQFGVPVGSFQAVQHMAAQMLRDTEMAAVATLEAAWVADNESDRLPRSAAMAKAAASAAGRSVTAAAIQLHGGIGFTWEAEPHWLFKRAQVDAAYLGGPSSHQAELARALAAALPTSAYDTAPSIRSIRSP